MPVAFSRLFKGPHDWDYDTEPEGQLNGRRLYWPRGKTLGGSSAINAMVYIRGHRSDYDHWRDLGNPGWGFDEVLPYFLRSEDNARGPSSHHGTGGPLAVSDLRSPNPISLAFVEAAQELGLADNDDFNGGELEGVGLFQVTQREGLRCSTAQGFLREAEGRPNLQVQTDVSVRRIIVKAGRAIGVELEQYGEHWQILAEREVLLCAGAVNTPQLLMLSGIGDADLLREHDVPVIAHLPGVGRNLQDHPAVPLIWTTDERVSLLNADTPEALYDFLSNRRGPLTSNIGEAGGFVRVPPGLPAPDIQFSHCAGDDARPRPHTRARARLHDRADTAGAVEPRTRGDSIRRSGRSPAHHGELLQHRAMTWTRWCRASGSRSRSRSSRRCALRQPAVPSCAG